MRKEKREKKEKRKRKEEKWKQKHIHTDKQIDRETHRQIDTNHSLIWDTILNNIANQIQ